MSIEDIANLAPIEAPKTRSKYKKNRLMVEPNDWRLQGQEKYLKGETLFFKNYSETKFLNWDHDHCEFCGATFSLKIEGALTEGYCTADTYRWICPNCFEDFKVMFDFKLGSPPK